MSYGIWLSWNNKEDEFQLPINPGSIEIGDGSKSETYDVASLGEIAVIKNPKLTTYSFDGLFPVRNYPFASAPILNPITVDGIKYNPYVYYLKKWMESKRPIRFVLVGDGYQINTPAIIESFTWQDVGGSGGDITYSLSLKKFVFYAARRVTFVKPEASETEATQEEATITVEEPERSNDRQPPSSYTLAPGDNLWKVAQLQLGDGSRASEIQQLNGISDAESKQLQIGRVLMLPT